MEIQTGRDNAVAGKDLGIGFSNYSLGVFCLSLVLPSLTVNATNTMFIIIS